MYRIENVQEVIWKIKRILYIFVRCSMARITLKKMIYKGKMDSLKLYGLVTKFEFEYV